MIDLFRRLFKVAFAEWKLFYTDPAAVLLLVVAGGVLLHFSSEWLHSGAPVPPFPRIHT